MVYDIVAFNPGLSVFSPCVQAYGIINAPLSLKISIVGGPISRHG
ncbi:hypothetical protein KDA_18650 [Dictyobacter alpinus]|uniref:Uncharacterized protein n=1 Tax=Dictyobacter alpinus TaxID=2014873 RepID=A0A402B4W3_9CHLR|nr:hypothetical protein KDA_18650 [Dictyobacter alpinus]